MPEARAHVGTSGWNYRWWRGVFYPEDVPQRDWHSYYVRHFDTVEINATFYRLQRVETFERWRAAAPQGFVYAVKAGRFITHLKRLQDCEEPLANFLEGVRALGATLGPILYQLPPRFESDAGRLDAFVDLLPKDLVHVFEFRDASWFNPQIKQLLERRGLVFCIHDHGRLEVPTWVTGPAAYWRFHGFTRGPGGNYADDALAAAAKRMREELARGVPVYAYFNNDAHGYAVQDAMRLVKMLGIGEARREPRRRRQSAPH
ncbi:MAG TPA: DUF72 domain-containing protein [Hyphomicrobiaceae bacterium]|jgi:uncharacterized protein YecE (DUF72 family)|nr:DUF72 domain-containing protein [Hyphomicrobiaceae bacterium]